MNITNEIQIYMKCPEIRAEIRQVYAAKIGSILTMIVMSPLLGLGLFSIMVVHVFDYIGQLVLWLPHRATDWLHDYELNQIRSAHAKVTLEEIRKRTKKTD